MAKTIILIDDDVDDLEVLRETIKNLDPSSHCISFIYPAEALRVVCEELIFTPDYLFIDINMPGVTGDQCVREIRKRKEFNNSVITVLSTSIPQESAEALKNIGADYTFQKPTSSRAYDEIVKKVLKSA